jgi:hypothetical protein
LIPGLARKHRLPRIGLGNDLFVRCGKKEHIFWNSEFARQFMVSHRLVVFTISSLVVFTGGQLISTILGCVGSQLGGSGLFFNTILSYGMQDVM